MLKQFVFSFMAFVMLTVHASAATGNSLKAVFDELNYALTVEWDQKDKAFYDAQVKKFADRLSALKAQGVTNAQLIDAALAQVKDEKLAKELRTAFTMIEINKMSESEATKTLKDIIAKSQATGAAWSSEASMFLLVGAIVAVIVVIVLLSPKCVESQYVGEQYICTDEWDPYWETWVRWCRWEPIYECTRYEENN